MGASPPAPPQPFDYGFVGTYSGAFSERYRVIKQIGTGAEGAAYLVERISKRKGSRRRSSVPWLESFPADSAPLQYVAKQTHDLSPQGRRVFLAEFMKMRELQHPHCLRVIELVEGKDLVNGHYRDQVYVISELARGGDLFNYMRGMLDSVSAVDEAWVAEVFRQAMQGVAFMHDKGVVHNDLKPDNILVMDKFEPSDPARVPAVKVSDFGCATLSRDTDFSWGDPRYQSPETWKRIVMVVEKHRSPHDFYKMSPKADVWSLGVMLFELLSGGKIPFLYRHASLNDVLDHKGVWRDLKSAVQSEEVRIGEHCGRASAEVQELLRQMLQKDPDARPSVPELLRQPWFGATKQRLLDSEALDAIDLNCVRGKAHSVLLNALVAKLRTDRCRDCWKAFQAVDTDCSGSIRCQEFVTAMTELGRDAAESERAFHAADVDGDGKLVFREFMAAAFDWTKLEKEARDTGLRRLFYQIDANRSGKVSERELVGALRGAVDPEAVREVFDLMDLDGDGKVSLDEFEAFLLAPCTEGLAASFRERRLRARRASRARGAAPCLAGCEAWLEERRRHRLRERRSVRRSTLFGLRDL